MPWRTHSNYNFGDSYDWVAQAKKAGAGTAYVGEKKPFLRQGDGTPKTPEMTKLVNFLKAAHSSKAPVGISKLESLLFEAPTPIGKSACYTGEIVDSRKNKCNVNVNVVSKAALANPVAKAAMAKHVNFVSKLNRGNRGIANMELFLENNDFMFTVMPSEKIQCFNTVQGAAPEYAKLFVNKTVSTAKFLHFNHIVYNGFALPLLAHEDGAPKLTQFYTALTLQRSSNGWAMKRDATQALTGQDSMYAAPEVLVSGQNYTFAADFFSIGCSAFELATGLRLWGELIGATSDPVAAQVAMSHDSAQLQKAIDALLKKNIKDDKLRARLSELLKVNADQRQKLCDSLPLLSVSDTAGQEFAAANAKNQGFEFSSVFESLAGAGPTSTRGVQTLKSSVSVPGASTTFYHKKTVTHDAEGADWGTGLAVVAAAGVAASACMYFATSNLIKQGSTMTSAGPATLAISNGVKTDDISKSEDGKMQIEVVPAVATEQPADNGMKAKIAGLLGCLVPTVAGVTYLATKEGGDKKPAAACKSETETLMFSETGSRVAKLPSHPKESWETKLLVSVLKEEEVFTKNLSTAQINKVVAAMETVEFSAGQKVVLTGEVSDYFYVYRKGQFATSTGRNMPADGYLFNDMALVMMVPSMETITAVGASSAFRISRSTFKQILLK